jgi:DNA excision repair protein ERCC-4
MLEKFGSPARTLNASFAELSKVEGLGEARAKKIRQMLEQQSKLRKKSDQSTLDS